MMTRALMFSTAPPPGVLVPHAVHEHIRILAFQWPCRHESMSSCTFLSLYLNVWDGMRSPHSNC